MQSAPNNRGLKLALIIVAFVVIPCFAICVFFYIFAGKALTTFGTAVSPLVSCAMTFEATSKSIQDYAEAHDGKLPPAATWEKDIAPYYQKRYEGILKKRPPEFLKMKFEPSKPGEELACSTGDKTRTGIAYNADVAGKKLADIPDPAKTVLIYEVEAPGKNLVRPYKPLDKEKAPTIAGEHRQWLVVHADFKSGKNKDSGLNFDIGD